MSRTPAKFTQADVARTIRAAKQAGAYGVELMPDGTIRIALSPLSQAQVPPDQVDDGEEIVL
jgi:hypothetical protein